MIQLSSKLKIALATYEEKDINKYLNRINEIDKSVEEKSSELPPEKDNN